MFPSLKPGDKPIYIDNEAHCIIEENNCKETKGIEMGKPKALLIAEKPSYRRTIEACYNNHINDMDYDIDFMAQRGHALELLTPDQIDEAYKTWDEKMLPIIPSELGGYKYKVMHDMIPIVKEAKEKIHSGEYDYVIHAGDPDQEGELLTRLLLERGARNNLPVLRLWPNDTTDAELHNALKSMKPDNDSFYENLYSAGLVRQHADWLFGMNGSRAASARIYTGDKKNKVAVGRVMTAVLAMIVHREDAIKNFVEKITYGVALDFAEGYTGKLFRLVKKTDPETGKEKTVREEIYYDTKEEAEQHIAKLSSNGTVLKVQSKKKSEYAPKLFDLPAAQIEAAKMGYSADKTLEIIQGLYEKSLLTYPRTSCEVLGSTENFTGILDSLEKNADFTGVVSVARKTLPNVLKSKKYVNDAEKKKHGHSALIPTTNYADYAVMTDDEIKIYDMVARRYLAIFLPPCVEEEKRITTRVDNDLFTTSGKVVIDPGYTTFLGINKEENELPKLTVGQPVTIKASNVTEKKATPPKRFTDGTIVAAMKDPKKYLEDIQISKDLEDFHIGTPATRAEIIKKLNKDNFITTKKNTLYPTEWGTFFIHKIEDVDITKVDMTGKWELLLDQVRQGLVSGADAENVMVEESSKMVESILHMDRYTFGDMTNVPHAIGVCPKCGKNIIKTQKAIFCEDWKVCGLSIPRFVTKFSAYTDEEALKLFAGETITKELEIERVDEATKKKIRRKWKQDLHIEKGDDGRYQTVFNKTAYIETKTDFTCPDCGDTLIKKGSRLSCKCGFGLWTTYAKRTLDDSVIRELINNKKTREKITGLLSKKGTKYSAYLTLERTDDGCMIKPVFE